MGGRSQEAWRFLPALIGALTAGRRKSDGIIRLGFAGAVVFAVLRLLEGQLGAERVQRREEHQELVRTIRETSTAIRDLQAAVVVEHEALEDLRGALAERLRARPGAGR